MYTLVTTIAILAGIIFGLGYGLFNAERRFSKIQNAVLKVYLNPDEKPSDKLLDDLITDIWFAMYK